MICFKIIVYILRLFAESVSGVKWRAISIVVLILNSVTELLSIYSKEVFDAPWFHSGLTVSIFVRKEVGTFLSLMRFIGI